MMNVLGSDARSRGMRACIASRVAVVLNVVDALGELLEHMFLSLSPECPLPFKRPTGGIDNLAGATA